jgi:hypothetical protein
VYAAKAAHTDELNAPDAPAVSARLTDRIEDTKRGVLERVGLCLQNDVGETAAKAIRTESGNRSVRRLSPPPLTPPPPGPLRTGKSYFKQELQKGVIYILNEVGPPHRPCPLRGCV